MVNPTVSISSDTNPVIESQNDNLHLNFDVTGTIPSGGLPIQVRIDNPNNFSPGGGLNNFWFLDFLSGELEATQYELEGDGVNVNLQEVDSSGNPQTGTGKFSFIDGPDFGGEFTLILTADNAELILPILDDNFPEINEDVTFSILPGAGYDIGTGSTTVTLQDTPTGTANPLPTDPVVSISADPFILIENEQTEYTITFDVDGAIPAGGLDVAVTTGIPNAVGEFFVGRPKFTDDVYTSPAALRRFVVGVEADGFAQPFTPTEAEFTNSPDPAGVNYEALGFERVQGDFTVQPTEIGDGYFGTIVNNQATITLSVNDDGNAEGIEVFKYTLQPGENYQLGDDNSYVLFIGDNRITGTNGNDFITGSNDQEIISGLKGDDKIVALGGDDLLTGDRGKDLLFGGSGDDTVFGGQGKDTISGGFGDDVLSGDKGRDLISGNVGNDSVFGGQGRDTISGGFGDDLLSGDAGNDTISGGFGDDLLMGVTGNDKLFGGFGADTFVFGNGDGKDLIVDFRKFQGDKIGLVEGELTFGDLTFTSAGFNKTNLGVASTGEQLALVQGISASNLNDSNLFVTVPDISNINHVL